MWSENEDWRRLASYVISARIRAGYKDRRAFAAATGITERTLGKLEKGQHVSPETLAAIEPVLGWKPDSARQVLRGTAPVLADDAGEQRRYADPKLQAIWELPGFSDREREKMIDFALGWRANDEPEPQQRRA